jgi:putative heme-binding domain-containing protein
LITGRGNIRTIWKTGYLVLALSTLSRAQDPAPAQENPFETPQDLKQGGSLFQTHCSYCHGAHGEGGRGPDLTVGQYMHGGSDAELYATVRNGVPGSEMPSVKISDDEVWRLVGFVKRLGSAGLNEKAPGNAAAGRAVYEGKGRCGTCHTIDMQGGTLGPDLTFVGKSRDLRDLEESLVKPEADVPIRYRAIRVTTKSGQTVVGTRLNEDELSIQLRDTNDNLRSFLKDNLKEIRRDRPSLMPAYGSILTRTELEDVIAYLSSLRGVR